MQRCSSKVDKKRSIPRHLLLSIVAPSSFSQDMFLSFSGGALCDACRAQAESENNRNRVAVFFSLLKNAIRFREMGGIRLLPVRPLTDMLTQSIRNREDVLIAAAAHVHDD